MRIGTPEEISTTSFLDRKESGFLHFVKYHGHGNDFILVDNRDSTELRITPEQAVKLCDRNFGIGADGVIFAMPGVNGTYYTMRIFNSDGSEPEKYPPQNGVVWERVFKYPRRLALRASSLISSFLFSLKTERARVLSGFSLKREKRNRSAIAAGLRPPLPATVNGGRKLQNPPQIEASIFLYPNLRLLFGEPRLYSLVETFIGPGNGMALNPTVEVEAATGDDINPRWV
ncbi:hypothetical protein F3Y22_tig00109978pilonHSYRG00001 [Hibiscus syriacus]|uniref:Diaminopimelate epimerase n=1 Tax=Hibiscus syriacus TaxID=106335 RepID=A0A6A3BT15_HIBSY|nr:hypothetical protein F3Y22_tig00109978pilonHSYRG00001 [Hibiscus syriacus]